ncbi:MAG: peptidase M61 [Gemmatimonas sp.]|nr:peptidase M61 [Gemmatimonas sp.]
MRLFPALLLAVAASAPLAAQRPLAVPANATLAEISFPNAVHREAEVVLTFREVPSGALEVRMARSSPGRYAAHDFAKNVYGVRASAADGRALPVERVAPNVWRVSGHRGTVRFSYTLFADRADGTYAGIDATRAHLNIPATFAYAPALATRPIYATFTAPDTAWRIATQLEPTADPRTFRAPHLQYFMDSPTHLGRLDVREWSVGPANARQTMRLALNHLGSTDEATRFTDLTKRVVNEMAAVFGEFPRFDFGNYTFIACYRPNCAGDGMEHRNSTSLTSSNSLAQSSAQLLGTVSHEFFHAWNVERIRPAALEPFDFSDANMSGELWFAEGFTNYYGPLVIHRAGITNTAQYARQIAGAVNTLTNHPGRRFFGPVGMSQQAPFVDAAASIDPNNRANMFISYYTYGEGIGLALDLTLRARGHSLDELMQLMWRRFGPQTAALAPQRGYAVADVQAALGEVAGDTAFAREFFARYIYGSELPDYATLLARAGFLLRPVAPQQAWIGDATILAAGLVAGPTTIGSPLYDAGIHAGDRIDVIATQAVKGPEDVARVLGQLRPGQQVDVTWESRDTGFHTKTVTLLANPRVEIVPFEDAGRSPSAEQLEFRRAWLSSRQR